jgi:phosphatidylethanolamine-binding protein (PEBP) family uncharacterized protein
MPATISANARGGPAPPAGDRAHRSVPALHALDVAQLA